MGTIAEIKIVKKCTVCMVGSWVVGLSAVAWGTAGIFNPFGFVLWLRLVCGLAGVAGLGFLAYQPPFPACPRCLREGAKGP